MTQSRSFSGQSSRVPPPRPYNGALYSDEEEGDTSDGEEESDEGDSEEEEGDTGKSPETAEQSAYV